MMLYSVSLFFKSIHSIPSKDEPLWEDSIILIEAIGKEEAKRKGELLGKKAEETYEAQKGDFVTWKFMRVESVCEIDDDKLKHGTELFSRFLRDSEVKSILTPFDD